MGQTFPLFAMPLVLTAAAAVAVPAIRPLGHGALLHGAFLHDVFPPRCLLPRSGEGVSDAHSG
jgi:hypothetical protein